MTVSDVLRIRRHNPTRLEGFVDASFAFAVTLLVISIGHVPGSVPEMLHALRGLPAFALCFMSIVRIWKSHRDWSRYYDLEDTAAQVLSLMLVFVVLVYVYPLRLLFALFFAWVSRGYLVDQPIELNSVDDLRVAFEVYGIGFGAISALFALLYRHALRRAGAIGLDAREEIATRMNLDIWTAFVGMALLSILSAALLPFRHDQPWLLAVPGMVYALSGFVTRAIKGKCARQLAALGMPA
jgi:uncharacterized membrane protein